MTTTVGGNAPTTQQKEDLAQAFDLVRVNGAGQTIGPDGQVVGGGVQNPPVGRTILTSGSYPLMTISDLTNMTYSQVAANLRSDGAGRAVRMAASAANGGTNRMTVPARPQDRRQHLG